MAYKLKKKIELRTKNFELCACLRTNLPNNRSEMEEKISFHAADEVIDIWAAGFEQT